MTFGVEATTDDILERIVIRQDGRDFESLNGEINLTTLNSNVDSPERRAIFEKIMAWTIDDIEHEISAEMKNFSRMAPGGKLTGFCGGSSFLKMIYQYEGNWNE